MVEDGPGETRGTHDVTACPSRAARQSHAWAHVIMYHPTSFLVRHAQRLSASINTDGCCTASHVSAMQAEEAPLRQRLSMQCVPCRRPGSPGCATRTSSTREEWEKPGAEVNVRDPLETAGGCCRPTRQGIAGTRAVEIACLCQSYRRRSFRQPI